MKEADLAWLAGIWEGEGSVMLYSRPVNEKRIQITPAIEVGNTDLHIMNKARSIIEELGATFTWMERMPKKGTKKFYSLRSQHARNIKTVLEAILPFMAGEKRAYSETLLSFVNRRLEKSEEQGIPLKHLRYDEEDYNYVRSSTTTRETPTGEDIVYSNQKYLVFRFQFSISDYVADGKFITNKAMQDLYYASELVSRFVPEQTRAIMTDIETKVLALGPESQTATSLNEINGAAHRWVASGTDQVLTPNDFLRVIYGMRKANVPMTNLVAIVDPSVEYAIGSIANIANISNNPRWEGLVREGVTTGMQFKFNIFGFDVYVSNYLKTIGSETIDGVAAGAGVANLFFSADSAATPFVGAWGQSPKVDSSYNKDFQREEYVVTARYGFKVYRPENVFVVISDTDQVG